MKALSWLFVASALSGSCVLGADPDPAVVKGDTVEQVLEKLGTPKGKVSGGRRTTFYYDRGTVDFLTGRVERVFLITAQEAQEKIAAREKAEEERRKRAEADRVRRLAEGQAQLAKAQEDKSLSAAPPGVRLAFWEEFRKKYPEQDVAAPIALARKELGAAQKDEGRLAEVIAMNNRAVEIEKRFKQLDADYAASLANWKRNEIDQERAKLTTELNTIRSRLSELLKN